MSKIIERLNDLFAGEDLTDNDLVNHAQTVVGKLQENKRIMTQMANNTKEQAMLGDFQKAVDDAILNSSETHQKLMMKLLAMGEKEAFMTI